MPFILSSILLYHDSNALFLCFEHVDIKWYHLLPMPLEFERMVSHLGLVLLVLNSTQKRKVEMKTKSNCAPDGSVMLGNGFSE